jgi:hypothetical protein
MLLGDIQTYKPSDADIILLGYDILSMGEYFTMFQQIVLHDHEEDTTVI